MFRFQRNRARFHVVNFAQTPLLRGRHHLGQRRRRDRFLADAMKKVENEGVITVEEATSLETDLKWSRECCSTAA